MSKKQHHHPPSTSMMVFDDCIDENEDSRRTAQNRRQQSGKKLIADGEKDSSLELNCRGSKSSTMNQYNFSGGTLFTAMMLLLALSSSTTTSNMRRSCGVMAWSVTRARTRRATPTPLSQRTNIRLYAAPSSSSGRISSAVQDKDLLSKSSTSSATSNKGSAKKQQQQEKLNTNPPKGTRDFYPPDMRLRTWLFDQWRSVARQYGFSEYDAPVLESEQLYTRKAGEEVTEQLYNFVDKGDRAVALRPEMTPSLARMVLQKKGALPLPLKWFSIPQCWRYERMTRGRRREHFQWNMDVWGVAGEEAEAELLSAMVQFFQNVGLTADDVGIKINSRLVIGEVLTELGVPEEKFAATCVLVDKLEKVPIDAIQSDLEDLGLDRSVVEKLLDVLTNKSIDGLKATLGDDSVAVKQLSNVLTLCEAYGIQDWILFDASVVRGLAYYTGLVFEAFDRKGELRAIAGGGRYDKLLETFGDASIPAAGFGFGDAVIVELLKERNVLPSFATAGIDTVVFAMSQDLYPAAIQAASALRQAGQTVDVVLEQKKSKWVFKHADRLGAKFCLIVGSDEYANGEVAVKDLALGEQETVKIDGLKEWAESKEQPQ